MKKSESHYVRNLSDNTKQINETMKARGFSLEIRKAGTDLDETGKRVVLSFEVELFHEGKTVMVSPYTMGTGFLDLSDVKPLSTRYGFTQDESNMARSWKAKPCADFVDKNLLRDTAEKIRIQQGVVPQIADVMYSLILDGSAFFDGETFEEWCGNFGYDSDSIKARAIYDTCDETGRKLARVCDVEKIRETFQDY